MITPSAETDASSVIKAAKTSLFDRAASPLSYSAMKTRFAKGSLATHGLLSIGSQVAWGAQGFITFVMAGRMLPQKEFGFVVVTNAILFGAQCLLLGPTTNPTLRFAAVSDRSVRVTYWMYCFITGIVCSAFVLLGKQIGQLIYNDPAFFTLIKCLSIPFATTSFYCVQKLVLFAKTHYKIVLIMDILYGASNIAILIVLQAHAMLPSAIWFYMARSGAALVGLLPVVCLFIWWKHPVNPRIEKTFAYGEYFRHSKYSSISMLSSYAQAQVDTLAVAHYLTPLSAATYGAAKIFFTGITMITAGLTMVVLPASSRITVSGEGGLGRFYRRALLLAYALLLPSVAVLAVFVHPLLHLVFGSRYANAAPIVRIFCLAAFVIPVSSITDSVANGAGWWRHACVAAITGGVIGMAASLFLTRALGLSGAALAPILALSGSAGVIAFLTWGRLSTRSSALSVKAQYAATLAGEHE